MAGVTAEKLKEVLSLPEVMESNPDHIWIEPTNRCNTRCTHCGHFYEQFGEDMEEDLYEKIEREVLDDVTRAELIGYGEPFMAKHFMRMFDACVDRGIEIFTTSNGILLRNAELTSKVVRNNVTLCLSIDGTTTETFEFVRPYVRWKGLQKTLSVLKEQAALAGEERRYRLRFNFVAMLQNLADIPDLVRLAHEYDAKEILILPLGGEECFEKVSDQSPFRDPSAISAAFMDAIPLAKQYGVHLHVPDSFRPVILNAGQDGVMGKVLSWYRKAQLGLMSLRHDGIDKSLEKMRREDPPDLKASVTYCTMPYKDAYFASDGTVYPCCIMREQLGNMREQSWEEIWNGPLYRNLRRTVHSWNPSDVCRHCALPSGINGGDDKYYERYFSKLRSEVLSLDDPSISPGDGVYPLELNPEGSPSHFWLSKKAHFEIAMKSGAKFLRLVILPRIPVYTTNPGKATIEGLTPEPFDNSCEHIHLPLDGLTQSHIKLTLEMENGSQVGEDPRELSMAIRHFEFLY